MRFNYLGKCARDTGWLQKMRQFVMSAYLQKKVPVVNINVIIERLSTSVASVFGWVTVREPRCVGTSILHDFSTSFQYDL
jgi:hypothetical protein